MDKPLSLRLNELRQTLAQTINSAQLPLYLVEPIVKEIAIEVSSAAQQQADAEKAKYEEESAKLNEE